MLELLYNWLGVSEISLLLILQQQRHNYPLDAKILPLKLLESWVTEIIIPSQELSSLSEFL